MNVAQEKNPWNVPSNWPFTGKGTKETRGLREKCGNTVAGEFYLELFIVELLCLLKLFYYAMTAKFKFSGSTTMLLLFPDLG